MKDIFKENKPANEPFSEKELMEKLRNANSQVVGMDNDGELIRKENEDIELSMRELGSQSITYDNYMHQAKKTIRGAILVASGFTGFVGGITTNNVELSFAGVPALVTGLLEIIIRDDNPVSVFKYVKEQKRLLQIEMKELGLNEDYINKHFEKIVGFFRLREQNIQTKEEELRVEKDQQEEFLEARKKLKLGEKPEEESLESFLEDQKVKADHKINK
jgi:hypothetical protein